MLTMYFRLLLLNVSRPIQAHKYLADEFCENCEVSY